MKIFLIQKNVDFNAILIADYREKKCYYFKPWNLQT